MEHDEDILLDMIFDAATDAGFTSDGEGFFISNEMLAMTKSGDGFDLTEALENFAFSIIEGVLNIQDLMKTEGKIQ